MASFAFSWLAVIVSFFVAMVLELVSLPDLVVILRPEWLVLTVIYWVLRHPEKMGVAAGFLTGLAMDVMSGSYFGIHSLALSLVCYLVLGMHQRLKMFPVIQQSAVIFFITGIHLMIVYTMRSLLSVADGGLEYLWQALVSAFVWPFVVVLYDRLVFALR